MEINTSKLGQIFKDRLTEVEDEPEFRRNIDRLKFATDENGQPLIKLAVGNMPLDYDLWEGLRNPATVGLHPAGLPELWEFYANRRRPKVDEAGRPTIFQVPRTFDYALDNYNRAVIISVMLPFSEYVIDDYVKQVIRKRLGSSHTYTRMYEDVNLILDKTMNRVAIDMVIDDTDATVLPMTVENVTTLSTEAMPQTKQGVSHGPSKGGNYPQKSVAALLGLGQFGIARIIFRDELVNGKVRRYAGPIRSLVLFDKDELVMDGKDGIIYPSNAWRNFLLQLFDFTNTDPEVNKHRFCSHIPLNDKGCSKCIDCCPSGAQESSTPLATGEYLEQVARQNHRFWEGKLQFDYGKCCDERGQMIGLLPEWSCSRCVTICINQGIRRKHAAQSYYQKMQELARDAAPVLA